MDIFSVIGLILATIAIIGGSILKGSGVSALVNPAAFVIVAVGTLASIMLHTPKLPSCTRWASVASSSSRPCWSPRR